ncbi:hypothetical protein [Tolypothrix sp. VBCCA 56010]|uniref:hypothetical protein n=1 Tax=Tolypothrix sp. VBCCA 56010 TaxID=3137731 RepID=UPI003D7EBCD2
MTDWKPIICTGVTIIQFTDEDEDENEDENNDEKIQTVEITGNDLDWETEVEDADRPMGAEVSHSATYHFGRDFSGREITWTVYEYPQGSISGDVQVDIEGGEIIKNFDSYELTPESVEVDDFDPDID